MMGVEQRHERSNRTEKADEQRELERTQLRQLVLRAQTGERQAFEQLVRSTEKLVRRIAYSTVGPRLVEDAFQESYLLVLRKLGQLRKPEAFIGWLTRIVLHVCYDLRRDERTELEFSEDASSPDHSDTVLAGISIHRALHQLHRTDREVLILRELLELSYEEVAGALRLPVGTVRSRLHKARKNLAERLGAENG
jgi:RNA polymerase sigma factor (sigma-70 family)